VSLIVLKGFGVYEWALRLSDQKTSSFQVVLVLFGEDDGSMDAAVKPSWTGSRRSSTDTSRTFNKVERFLSLEGVAFKYPACIAVEWQEICLF